jgi:hypothetical protein
MVDGITTNKSLIAPEICILYDLRARIQPSAALHGREKED